MGGKARVKLFVRKCCAEDVRTQVFRDELLLDAIVEACWDKYHAACMAGNVLIEFFEFLIEHQEEIAALIKLIISLIG